MSEQDLLVAIKDLMDKESEPQRQAAAWLRIASVSIAAVGVMVVWMALEIRGSTIANQNRISVLETKMSVAETLLKHVDFKE